MRRFLVGLMALNSLSAFAAPLNVKCGLYVNNVLGEQINMKPMTERNPHFLSYGEQTINERWHVRINITDSNGGDKDFASALELTDKNRKIKADGGDYFALNSTTPSYSVEIPIKYAGNYPYFELPNGESVIAYKVALKCTVKK
jgi:hypothetical protein